MACPGLHCPGCSEGQSAGIAVAAIAGLVLLDQAVPWVAARIWWIGSTAAVCFALAVAASMWLETRSERRGREWGAERGIYSRADYIAPVKCVPRITEGERPAIAPHVTVNIFGMPDAEQAEVIRKALGRN